MGRKVKKAKNPFRCPFKLAEQQQRLKGRKGQKLESTAACLWLPDCHTGWRHVGNSRSGPSLLALDAPHHVAQLGLGDQVRIDRCDGVGEGFLVDIGHDLSARRLDGLARGDVLVVPQPAHVGDRFLGDRADQSLVLPGQLIPHRLGEQQHCGRHGVPGQAEIFRDAVVARRDIRRPAVVGGVHRAGFERREEPVERRRHGVGGANGPQSWRRFPVAPRSDLWHRALRYVAQCRISRPSLSSKSPRR
jgi:hypothetical protein